MRAAYRPTTHAGWVKSVFGLELPVTVSTVYPGYPGIIVVQSHRDSRQRIGSARFGLVPAGAS